MNGGAVTGARPMRGRQLRRGFVFGETKNGLRQKFRKAECREKRIVKEECDLLVKLQVLNSLHMAFIPCAIVQRLQRIPARLTCRARPHMSATQGKVPEGRKAENMNDGEWRGVLSREEFRVLREKGTERAGSGEYDGFYPSEGHFVCLACGNALYSASAKFKSGCGWPAFDKCYKDGIRTNTDTTFGMKRVEIVCARCDGHLGHVFGGERMTESNERHCVNSVSVKYMAGKIEGKQEEKVL